MSYESYLTVFARALGLCAVLPFDKIGSGGVTFRLSLSLLFALLLGGAIDAPSLTPLGANVLLLEFLIGALVGVPGAIFVECGAMWGELYDTGRGQTIGSILDPSSQTSHSYTSFLGKEVCIVWFFLTGSFESLIVALRKSFEELGPGTLASKVFEGLGAELMRCISSSTAGVMGAILPFAFLFMAVEVGGAFVSKIAPIPLNTESFLLKSTLGSLCLLLLITANGTESVSGFIVALSLK